MPDKISDNDIKKALECCKSDTALCNECPYDKIGECIEKMCADSIDLINRQKAKAIKEQNKNSKLRNERNRLQAQNKDLAETVHNLTIEKDALFDKVEELKAEIERLKNAYEQVAWERDIFAEDMKQEIKKDCSYLMLDIKTIKASAYKEFAEKLHEELRIYGIKDKFNKSVFLNIADKVKKEMVGEDNG